MPATRSSSWAVATTAWSPPATWRGPASGCSSWRQPTSRAAGCRTDETIPGYLFNTHAAAHNIINMTRIPAELDLAGAGLEYLPMDPFATGFFRDGRVVRFHRDLEQTVESIAEHSRADAEAYRAFMRRAIPLVKTAVDGPGERLDPRRRAEGRREQDRAAAARGRARRRSGRARARPGGAVRLAAARPRCRATSPGRRSRRSPATPPPGRTPPAGRSTSSGRRPTTCSGSGTRAAARSR